MIRQLKLVIFLNIILPAVSFCWAAQKIETIIGPLDLGSSSISESNIISQYGQGFVQEKKYGNKVLEKKRVYYIPSDRIWIEIRFSHVLDENLERYVEEILITKQKLCDETYKPTTPFGPLVTSKGVRIGDSINKVIKIYGAPSVSIEIGKDKTFSALDEDLKFKKGRVLRYLPDDPDKLIFSEFYFSGGKLHSMLISISE